MPVARKRKPEVVRFLPMGLGVVGDKVGVRVLGGGNRVPIIRGESSLAKNTGQRHLKPGWIKTR